MSQQPLITNEMFHELSSSGLPYVAQFMGPWAMTSGAIEALQLEVSKLDIKSHMAAVTQRQLSTSQPMPILPSGVAIAEIKGPLTKQQASLGGGTSTVELRRQIRAALRMEEVTALLLHIDSPGGTVAGTDDLAQDIRAFAAQKPVIAYIEDLGASAAYWHAAQANEIYTNAQAVVGYIGVLNVVRDLSQAADKAGIVVHTIKFGEFKGAGIPGTEITDAQLAEFQREVDTFGQMFVDAIATGRNISQARALTLADARTYIGQEAADIGLTDGVKPFEEVLELLAARGAASTSKGRASMSKQNEPVGATLAELEAALPEADSDFLVSQLRIPGITVELAEKAYAKSQIEKLRAELAERDEKAQALTEELQAAQAKKDPPPDPIAPRTTQAPIGDTPADPPPVTFMDLVKEKMAEGMDRRSASRQLAKIHPELFEKYLDTAPDLRSDYQRDALKV